ncbi:MAG TPA: 3-phosphoshikimate 1-carboxyvinyltransferase [Armatimonadota bacterium]|nr:3-phosphoshikimate 1-carboxyvinyltransferase [Armatimonadota bacterium]
MRYVVRPSSIAGSVRIPPSKSHTIRALLIGSVASGTSRLHGPLESEDTRACLRACRALGASIEEAGGDWLIEGLGGPPRLPDDVLDVGNSGTTLYLAMGLAALIDGWTVFTGDEQIRRRTAQPLLSALEDLGALARSSRDNGCAPVLIRGPMRGGSTVLEARSSQYLSSLLLSAPLAPEETHIRLSLLNERPYAEMTLRWLERCGIRVEASDDRMEFRLPGGQCYRPVSGVIPADFSSATFFLCAAAITGSELTLEGLDMADPQGDKAVVDMLAAMGAAVVCGDGFVRIRGGELRGVDLDLNATPDALPALAVVGCFARGTTRLLNVPQARIKETDRIATMRQELEGMGARVEELDDGLVIHESPLRGARVHGHHDHRLVMALTVAGLAATGTTEIETAESAAVTFPTFAELMRSIGADLSEVP